MKYFLDLFSGIGGFALGAYWAGLKFDEHYFSEVDDYAIKVYQHEIIVRGRHYRIWAEEIT